MLVKGIALPARRVLPAKEPSLLACEGQCAVFVFACGRKYSATPARPLPSGCEKHKASAGAGGGPVGANRGPAGTDPIGTSGSSASGPRGSVPTGSPMPRKQESPGSQSAGAFHLCRVACLRATAYSCGVRPRRLPQSRSRQQRRRLPQRTPGWSRRSWRGPACRRWRSRQLLRRYPHRRPGQELRS